MTSTVGLPVAEPLMASPETFGGALLLGVGTAVSRYCWSQVQVEVELAKAWNLRGTARERWRRICTGAEVEHRYGIATPDALLDLTTAQRMERFELEAPPIAADAASKALRAANIAASDITDLIIVSCTGFSAPGLDVALVDALELPQTVRRVQVGYMGCFGALTGLRTAVGACAADSNATALMVCCELCSLHVRRDADVNNQVASALFGDGAAAAVVGQRSAETSPSGFTPSPAHPLTTSRPPLGRIGLGGSRLLPEGRSRMTWRITDAGFAMTLARTVPTALQHAVSEMAGELQICGQRTMITHPGGPGIIDAVQSGLGVAPDDPGLAASRAILRDYGNMSSGTVLFVLDRVLRQRIAPPWQLIAFGPGLTIEHVPVLPATGE